MGGVFEPQILALCLAGGEGGREFGHALSLLRETIDAQ